MESDNTSKREPLHPRDPPERELRHLAEEASLRSTLRSESARPAEPGIDIAQHLARDLPLAPPEPGEKQLAHLVSLSAHAISTSARVLAGEALRPREPSEEELREMVRRG